MSSDIETNMKCDPPSCHCFSLQVLEHRLKEADEMHTLLQLECEKYKSVLAETVGNDLNYILILCVNC